MTSCGRCTKRERTEPWESTEYQTTCGYTLCGACVDELTGRDGFKCPFCPYDYNQDPRSEAEEEAAPHVFDPTATYPPPVMPDDERPELAQRDHRADVLAILNDSDATCQGCGADPRDLWRGLEGRGFITDDRPNPLDVCANDWYMALDGDQLAELLCPECLGAEVFALPEITR